MSAPSPAPTNSNVQLLAVLADFDDEDESEYRFLVDGRHVKYVTVDPGVLPKDDRTFAPVLLPALPPFPAGDWNVGRVSRDAHMGRPVFASIKKRELPGVQNTWRPTVIDHLEFKKLDRLRQNIYVAAHPGFDRPVVVKHAEFPWQIPYLEAETRAYQWIDGRGIGPRFLGHVTEGVEESGGEAGKEEKRGGRVIGFVMEYVDGGRAAAAANPADLAACQRALARLHALGIKHGDVNKHNFVLLPDREEAVLIDFEAAERDRPRDELDAEYRALEGALSDMSGRGGIGVTGG